MKRILALLLAVMTLCLCACSGSEPAQVNMDVNSLYTSMEATLPEMVKLDDAMMLNLCGIEAAKCKQAVVAVANDGLRADEIWLIEAQDAETAAQFEKLAQNRIKYKGEESITYSPEQYAIVQKAKVILSGNYLTVIVSPDVDTLVGLYNTAAGK